MVRVAVKARLLALAVVALVFAGALAGSAQAKTTWLCKPGMKGDPCTPSLRTTVFSNTGSKLRVENVKAAKAPKIDCFYVYPTVSDQPGQNANLTVDPVERSIALYQAARYSQVCRVFAPMYRQGTIGGLGGGGIAAAYKIAYADVLAAWKDYLAHFNHGRPFVLIGHSQGTFHLRKLLSQQIDPKPALRKRLISAILLGGNVLVKKGKDVGGDFKHVPACRSDTQLGCVVAFSSFDQVPPADSKFGRRNGGAPGALHQPGLAARRLWPRSTRSSPPSRLRPARSRSASSSCSSPCRRHPRPGSRCGTPSRGTARRPAGPASCRSPRRARRRRRSRRPTQRGVSTWWTATSRSATS